MGALFAIPPASQSLRRRRAKAADQVSPQRYLVDELEQGLSPQPCRTIAAGGQKDRQSFRGAPMRPCNAAGGKEKPAATGFYSVQYPRRFERLLRPRESWPGVSRWSLRCSAAPVGGRGEKQDLRPKRGSRVWTEARLGTWAGNWVDRHRRVDSADGYFRVWLPRLPVEGRRTHV